LPWGISSLTVTMMKRSDPYVQCTKKYVYSWISGIVVLQTIEQEFNFEQAKAPHCPSKIKNACASQHMNNQ
jgi:hypothetical protein